LFKQSPYFALADQGLIPLQTPPAPRWVGIVALRLSTVIVTCLTRRAQCLGCAQLFSLAVPQQSEQLLVYSLSCSPWGGDDTRAEGRVSE